jgi:hypothetical protein
MLATDPFTAIFKLKRVMNKVNPTFPRGDACQICEVFYSGAILV